MTTFRGQKNKYFRYLKRLAILAGEDPLKKEERRLCWRLVLSGGDYQGISPDALIMQQVALDQGVARDRIILETASWDTTDQTNFLRDRLGQAPFYLVTSAGHMTRAMRMFIRSGTQPIAAPTDFLAVWAPFSRYRLFSAGRSLGQYRKGIL